MQRDFNFKIDLAKARVYEYTIGNLLSSVSKFDSIEFAPEEKFYDWDFKGVKKGKEITFELKTDYMGQKTGNIAIEFQCWGKDSGIYASKSDYWVYYLPELEGKNLLLIDRVELLKFIKENDFRVVSGGEDYAAKMFLIPINKIDEIAKRFKVKIKL